MSKPKLMLFGVDGVPGTYIRQQVAQGKLPGYAKLMEKGVFFNDMQSVFPTISPTCWNSIYTGALPKVHGGVCDILHYDNMAPWEFHSAYSPSNIKAEPLWITAARAGAKSLLLDVLGSGITNYPEDKYVSYVMGSMTVTPNKATADTDITGVPQQYFSVKSIGEQEYIYACGASMPQNGWQVVDNDRALFLYKNGNLRQEKSACESMGDWKFFDDKDSTAVQNTQNSYTFQVVTDVPKFQPDEVEPFTWTLITETNGIRIGATEDEARKCPVITKHKWSDVMTRKLMTDSGRPALFHFRAYCEELDTNSGIHTVYITAARNLLKEIKPVDCSEAIMQIPEIHTICWADFMDNPNKCIDTLEFNIQWKQKIIQYAIEHWDYDILFDYNGLNDTFNHYEMAALYHELETETLTHERAVNDFTRAYQMIDDHILWLLDHAVGEDTTFALFADHGSIAAREDSFFMKSMEKAGLTVYTSDDPSVYSWRNTDIDWSKTKAYCFGSCYVNVNLQGREPCGIVPPEEFDDVVREIIRALQMYTETSDGKVRGLAFAVPGTQAGFVGLGGPGVGDVVFGITGSALGGYFGGVHAVQIPSANTNRGDDMRPVCIMVGKQFKENCILERPTDLTDIAPTLCYAMGYPQPKDATGGIVFAAYRE